MERRSRTLSSPRAAIGNQRSIRRVSGMCRVLLSSSLLYRFMIFWLALME